MLVGEVATGLVTKVMNVCAFVHLPYHFFEKNLLIFQHLLISFHDPEQKYGADEPALTLPVMLTKMPPSSVTEQQEESCVPDHLVGRAPYTPCLTYYVRKKYSSMLDKKLQF